MPVSPVVRLRLPFRPRLLAAALVGLALGACSVAPTRMPPPAAPAAPVAPAMPPPASAAECTTCGRVERITAAPASAAGKGHGAVLGGVVGGGGRTGQHAAAPATSGSGASEHVRIVVLLDSGRRLILTQPRVSGMKVGSRVRVERSRAVLLR